MNSSQPDLIGPVDMSQRPSGGLYIRKQPSGGRGEYEIVGKHGDTGAGDLLGYELVLDTPLGVKRSGIRLGHQGQKLRLRLIEPNGIQIQRQLAAGLMMPPSTRSENSISAALPVLLKDRYILDARIELIAIEGENAIVRPVTIIARSGAVSEDRVKIFLDAQYRFIELQKVYDNAEALPNGLREMVAAHRSEVLGGQTIGKAAEKTVSHIMAELELEVPYHLPGSDPLPVLSRLVGASHAELDVPPPPMTPPDSAEIRLRSEHVYRQRRMRGPGAVRFRKDVQKAYNWRCAFCGFRAPAARGRSLVGNDAAHILPWGEYDLDVIENGIMLCKMHHWAFDSHLLILRFVDDEYYVEIASDAFDILEGDERTLDILRSVTGRIPGSRLPRVSQRPSPRFINELYTAVPYATSSLTG